MHLRAEVIPEDVERALQLIKSSTHSAATDPKTGLVDMDLLITGKSAHEREVFEEKAKMILDCFDALKDSGKEKVSVKMLRKALEGSMDEEITMNELNMYLKHFEKEEVISIDVEKGGVTMVEIL